MEKQDAGDVLVEPGVREMKPLPEFIGKRQVLWDKFKERYDQELKDKTPQPIKIETFDKVCWALWEPLLAKKLEFNPSSDTRLQLCNRRLVNRKRRKAKVGAPHRIKSRAKWSRKAGQMVW